MVTTFEFPVTEEEQQMLPVSWGAAWSESKGSVHPVVTKGFNVHYFDCIPPNDLLNVESEDE